MATPKDTVVSCPGMRHTIDYAGAKVTLTVPRSCLGSPRWVQVDEETGYEVDTAATATTPASSKVYLDDAFSPYESSYIHWSPKVFRG